MLDVINGYLHGFVAVPVVAACARGDLFALLEREPATLDDLAGGLRANTGHLAAALRLLRSLGWIELQGDRYRLTDAAAGRSHVTDEVLPVYPLAIGGDLHGPTAAALAPLIDAVAARWGGAPEAVTHLLDGAVAVPFLNALARAGLLASLQASQGKLPIGWPGVLPAAAMIDRLCLALGWLEEQEGRRVLSPLGRFVAERALITGTTASYAPLLLRLPDLLFGDPRQAMARDTAGRERHLDRALNVVASGFQHQKFFADLDELVVAIFDREPLDEQPDWIVDTGCGDGSLLRRIHDVIRGRTRRGAELARQPVVMVGADFNEAAREATARTLADVPHLVLAADIGDPDRLLSDLLRHGVDDPDRVLHVRSFLDHDRPLLGAQDRAAAAARMHLPYRSVSVGTDGGLVPAHLAVQSLVEHLRRWAGVVGRHGLLLLEVHCLDPETVAAEPDRTESLHFDAYHAFSRQHLVEADVFLMAAGEAGLLPRREAARIYPRTAPFARITLDRFDRLPLRVRPARREDLPALAALEAACWPEPLRAEPLELARRLEAAPDLQAVAEDDDGRVLGVVWAQRIESVIRLSEARHAELAHLAREHGPVVQLLGMNVLPAAQDRGIGDRLLDFALQWYRRKSGVTAVAGITRCRDYALESGTPPEAYVRQTDADGRPVDPILAFHVAHGAVIRGIVHGYRPTDTANLGCGVLIEHAGALPLAMPACGPVPEPGDLLALLESCVRAVRQPRPLEAWATDRPLREMGLDSLDLLELRALLGRHLGRELEPTFFFSYGTPAQILAALRGERTSLPTRRLRQRASPAAAATKPAAAGAEPIALIGIGCRFPGGADDPETLWQLLENAVDAIGPVPRDRFEGERCRPGTTVGGEGGFLRDVDRFDAAFFRLTPREARLMDPQQRLLLKVAWEALEHAGIAPDRLHGARAGFFVGQFSHDYETLLLRANRGLDLDSHFATGNSAAVTAGRLAYFFGAQGPTLAVDTACSSALVATHLGVRALRAGECDLALAGGINLILAPELSICFSRAGMLAPDGRCRTFDAAATGYVRSEGCGLVVLKRLSEALADGDPVVAVIRGSAVNQDGASNGLTAPNGLAQTALIRAALADADVDPLDVSFVETHGTGTPLGDPVEVAALAAVYAKNRPEDRPLVLGAIKSAIGHTEAAAGSAGLIKAALAVEHGWIPPQLHFSVPNPKLGLERWPIRIPTTLAPWPEAEGPRRAAVSSFGFSGTNAHVVLEAPPALEAKQADDPGPWLLPLSAASPEALDRLTDRYAAWLDRHPQAAPGDIAGTAAVGRSHLRWRRAIVAASHAELREQLTASAPAAEARDAPKVAFLFTGQGAQHPGMARDLYESEPVFRDTFDRCTTALAGELSPPLAEVIWGGAADRLNETGWTQPALYAVECGLVALWRAWGVEPAIVLGHSVGAFAAAWTAGVLTLEDGARLIAERGRIMQALPRGGAMLAVMAEEERARGACEPHAGKISVAAVNAPNSVVISGCARAVAAVGETLARDGIDVVPLAVSHAFHSPLMEPALEPFAAALEGTALASPALTMISDSTGVVADDAIVTPGYWCRHLREPVRFRDAIGSAVRLGAELFVEIGPQPTLIGLARRCPETRGRPMVASLRPGEDDRRGLLDAAAALYRAGARLDWSEIAPPHRRLRLPTYPFERRRCWFDAEPAYAGTRSSLYDDGHPLLGTRLPLPGAGEARFTARFAATTLPFFDEHRLCGRIVVPAASHVAMALLALAEMAPGPIVLEDLVFPHALRLADDGERTAQLVLERRQDGGALRLLSCPGDAEADEAAWLVHAAGRWRPAGGTSGRTRIEELERVGAERRTGAAFYADFAAAGYELGPSLQWIESLWLSQDEVVARMRPDPGDGREWVIYPGLLDACFQVMGVWFGTDRLKAAGELFVPYVVPAFVLVARPEPKGRLWVRAARRHRAGGDGRPTFDGAVIGDLSIYDESGRLLAEARGFEFHRVARATLLGDAATARLQHVEEWRPEPSPAALLAGVDLADAVDGAAALEALAARHARVALASLDDAARRAVPPWLQHWAAAPAPAAEVEPAIAMDPALVPVRALLDRCGPQVTAALRGEVKAPALLFPEGDIEPLAQLYRTAPSFRRANVALAGVVARLMAERPSPRIVELGAGTGATTAAVLDALNGRPCRYLFTDLSPRFLEAATARFGEHPGFATALLDIECLPAGQGLAEERFDLVLAANVLHATRDLRQSLAHALALLAPGGWLLLLEGTAARAWVDATFGLTEGWRRFADHDLRPDYPLLPAARWRALLEELGLEVEVVEGPPGQLYDQALILARPRSAPAYSRLLLAGGGVSGGVAARLAGGGLGEVVDEAGLAARLEGRGWDELVDLRGLDPAADCESPAAAAMRLADAGRRLAQALAGRVPVRLVTRGAVATAAGEPLPAPAAAALWGLAAAAACEEPDGLWRRVDLDPMADAAGLAAALAAELGCADGEDRVAWRGGARRLARLRRRDVAAAGGFVTRGTWLVSGGLGGLGRALGPWLRAHGAERVVLAGRRGGAPPPGCEARSLDVTDAAAVAAALRELGAGDVPLVGIVHAAGVLDDAPLARLDRDRLERVMGPKAAGAWHLHAASRDLVPGLERFVLFGSVAGVLGNAGQASHAAANAFLDGLAWHRRGHGLPATVVDWGAWDRIGAAAEATTRERLVRLGWRPMAPETALAELASALADDAPCQMVIADLAWERYADIPIVRPLLQNTLLTQTRTVAPERRGTAVVVDIRERLEARSAGQRLGLLEDHVASTVREVLGVERAVDREQGFFVLGMDSLISIELRNRLQQSLDLQLPVTIALDFPSVRSLTRRLAQSMNLPEENDGPELAVDGERHDTLAAEVAALSEAELEALIAQELAAVQGGTAA